MPGYQRFVTYMFRYKDEKKQENCGFAKIEIRQGHCRVQIQITGMKGSEAEVCVCSGGHLSGKIADSGGNCPPVFPVRCGSCRGDGTFHAGNARSLYLSAGRAGQIRCQSVG